MQELNWLKNNSTFDKRVIGVIIIAIYSMFATQFIMYVNYIKCHLILNLHIAKCVYNVKQIKCYLLMKATGGSMCTLSVRNAHRNVISSRGH